VILAGGSSFLYNMVIMGVDGSSTQGISQASSIHRYTKSPVCY
jgi:hypothetical protein